MPTSRSAVCYVSMPIGRKRDLETGNSIDFDAIYRQAIEPTVTNTGLVCRRVDSMTGGGVIQKTIIAAVLDSDVMIADLTLANPNVLYELGLRHAIHRGGTILISAASLRMPFDVAILPRIVYNVDGETMSIEESTRFGALLADALRETLAHEGGTDSPVYDFFPQINVTLPEIGLGQHASGV